MSEFTIINMYTSYSKGTIITTSNRVVRTNSYVDPAIEVDWDTCEFIPFTWEKVFS